MATTPAWTLSRPWRNKNPGDLRCLPGNERWVGQSGVDNAPGGPFAIFDSQADGWRALATCLLTYYRVHGLHTVDSIVERYAPSIENNTSEYTGLVCNQIGVKPNDSIDPERFPVMMALVSAISIAEGGPRIVWNSTAKAQGVNFALGLPGSLAPAAASPAVTVPAASATVESSDALNERELTRIESEG